MKKTWVSHFFCGLVGIACSAGYLNRRFIEKYRKECECREKMQLHASLLNQWLVLKADGISLEKYFTDNEIKTIAIYGFGELGKRFYEELKRSNVNTLYIVDQNADTIQAEIPVVKKTDVLEKVDALVVTAVYYFDEIEGELSEKTDIPVLSLEEVIYGI